VNHRLQESAASLPRRTWFWPLYLLTFIVVSLVLGLAFVVNFPAVESSRPRLDGNGKYGPHFELIPEYQHGWPKRYVRRESTISLDPPVNGEYWRWASPWKPWDRAIDFSWSALVWNAIFWFGILFGAAICVQRWRSRRRAVWQVYLFDLFCIISAVAMVVAWDRNERLLRGRERALYWEASERRHSPDDEVEAAIPAWLPSGWQDSYRREFGRIEKYDGEPRIAIQFPRLRVFQPHAADRDFGELLRRMPQLEALDLFICGFEFGDEAETFTLVRDFPPMPNLRGINLYETNVTDADLVWLAKCPQLECIELAGTKIGDDGLKNLAHLPKLRVLGLASEHITDDGCRTLGQIASLEDLYLSSDSVSDVGIKELMRLKKLQRLTLDTQASDAVIEVLRYALPYCSIN
jgi:hypothetical protein